MSRSCSRMNEENKRSSFPRRSSSRKIKIDDGRPRNSFSEVIFFVFLIFKGTVYQVFKFCVSCSPKSIACACFFLLCEKTNFEIHKYVFPSTCLLKILSSQKIGGSRGVPIDSSRLRTQSLIFFRYP